MNILFSFLPTLYPYRDFRRIKELEVLIEILAAHYHKNLCVQKKLETNFLKFPLEVNSLVVNILIDCQQGRTTSNYIKPIKRYESIIAQSVSC